MLMKDYIRRIIVPFTNGEPCLLLLDEHAAHRCPHVVAYALERHVHLHLIPAGYTWCLQPLEGSLKKAFKAAFRAAYCEWKGTMPTTERQATWQNTIDMIDKATRKMCPDAIRR